MRYFKKLFAVIGFGILFSIIGACLGLGIVTPCLSIALMVPWFFLKSFLVTIGYIPKDFNDNDLVFLLGICSTGICQIIGLYVGIVEGFRRERERLEHLESFRFADERLERKRLEEIRYERERRERRQRKSTGVSDK